MTRRVTGSSVSSGRHADDDGLVSTGLHARVGASMSPGRHAGMDDPASAGWYHGAESVPRTSGFRGAEAAPRAGGRPAGSLAGPVDRYPGSSMASRTARRELLRRRKARRRKIRRRLLAAALVVVAGTAVLFGVTDRAGGIPWELPTGARFEAGARPSAPSRSSVRPRPSSSVAPSTAGATPSTITFPAKGAATWHTAPGRSGVLGSRGTVLRFRVVVEKGIVGVSPDQFASDVTAALGDPRSWTGDGQRRLRRVGPDDRTDFTVYLATPVTRDELCGGVRDRYTSCRNGDHVVINVARWAHGVPHIKGPLADYRQYVINHEVGHRLGFGHELCPGPGRPAPVMQQQTLGLHGCVANAWPMRSGKPYHGSPGSYDDAVPPSG